MRNVEARKAKELQEKERILSAENIVKRVHQWAGRKTLSQLLHTVRYDVCHVHNVWHGHHPALCRGLQVHTILPNLVPSESHNRNDYSSNSTTALKKVGTKHTM